MRWKLRFALLCGVHCSRGSGKVSLQRHRAAHYEVPSYRLVGGAQWCCPLQDTWGHPWKTIVQIYFHETWFSFNKSQSSKPLLVQLLQVVGTYSRCPFTTLGTWHRDPLRASINHATRAVGIELLLKEVPCNQPKKRGQSESRSNTHTGTLKYLFSSTMHFPHSYTIKGATRGTD